MKQGYWWIPAWLAAVMCLKLIQACSPSLNILFTWKKKRVHLIKRPCAWSINSVGLKEKLYLFALQTQIVKLCASPTGRGNSIGVRVGAHICSLLISFHSDWLRPTDDQWRRARWAFLSPLSLRFFFRSPHNHFMRRRCACVASAPTGWFLDDLWPHKSVPPERLDRSKLVLSCVSTGDCVYLCVHVLVSCVCVRVDVCELLASFIPAAVCWNVCVLLCRACVTVVCVCFWTGSVTSRPSRARVHTLTPSHLQLYMCPPGGHPILPSLCVFIEWTLNTPPSRPPVHVCAERGALFLPFTVERAGMSSFLLHFL